MFECFEKRNECFKIQEEKGSSSGSETAHGIGQASGGDCFLKSGGFKLRLGGGSEDKVGARVFGAFDSFSLFLWVILYSGGSN